MKKIKKNENVLLPMFSCKKEKCSVQYVFMAFFWICYCKIWEDDFEKKRPRYILEWTFSIYGSFNDSLTCLPTCLLLAACCCCLQLLLCLKRKIRIHYLRFARFLLTNWIHRAGRCLDRHLPNGNRATSLFEDRASKVKVADCLKKNSHNSSSWRKHLRLLPSFQPC